VEAVGHVVGRDDDPRRVPGARVRDVREGPDGLLYLLTDDRNGQLIRLRPL